MDNFEAIQKINKRSYSKEDIKLINEDKSFLIKKTWKDVNRGLNSIKKQIDFDEISVSNLLIKSPKVFKTQIIDGLRFEAIMEYVEGYSGSDISLIGTREVSLNLKETLSMLINKNFENSKINHINIDLFTHKIEKIILVLGYDSELKSKLETLKSYFLKYKFLEIPCGPCHGDLTLSNIIVSRTSSLNLIDFLPTFIESPLWDIVKIYQDLKYGWSYRNLKGHERASSKIFFLNCLPSQLHIYEKVFKRQILLFDALNIARLCPYIKEKETRKWVINVLDSLLYKLSK